jgi:hypothetical protein
VSLCSPIDILRDNDGESALSIKRPRYYEIAIAWRNWWLTVLDAVGEVAHDRDYGVRQ